MKNKKLIRIASTPLGSDGLYIELGEDNVYFIKHPGEFNELIKKFCNSKVQNYVEFETIESRITQKYPNVADDELEGFECAREVIEVYKKIDPSAIYPYSYWANRILNYAINYFYDEDTKIESAIQSGKYSYRNDVYFDILIYGTNI